MQSEKLCILTADKSTLLTQRSELINKLLLAQEIAPTSYCLVRTT